jgi:hypothetical protein
MGVKHAMQVRTGHVNGTVDDESCSVNLKVGILEQVSITINLDQGRRRDVLVKEARGINKKVILGARHTQ